MIRNVDWCLTSWTSSLTCVSKISAYCCVYFTLLLFLEIFICNYYIRIYYSCDWKLFASYGDSSSVSRNRIIKISSLGIARNTFLVPTGIEREFSAVCWDLSEFLAIGCTSCFKCGNEEWIIRREFIFFWDANFMVSISSIVCSARIAAFDVVGDASENVQQIRLCCGTRATELSSEELNNGIASASFEAGNQRDCLSNNFSVHCNSRHTY